MVRRSVLTAVLMVAGAGCAVSGDPLGSHEAAIVNGMLDSTEAIGVLVSGKSQACTATLVGSRTVLTAAHCVLNRSPIAFYRGGIDGRRYNATSVAIHPDYAGANTADLAIVRLERVVDGVEPMGLARRAPLLDEQVVLVGFGKTGEGQGAFGIRRRADNRVGRIEAKTFSFFAKGQGLGNVCDGDSGGPTLALRRGKEVAIGVHSTKGGRCGDRGNDVRVDVFRGWIEREAQGDLADADVAAPQVQLVSPRPGAEVARTLTVSATAADDIAIARVTLYVDGQVAASRDRAPYRFTVNIKTLGRHQLKVVAYDAANNRSVDFIDVQVSDAVAPQSPDMAIQDLGAACEKGAACSTGLCAKDGASGLGFCTQQCDLFRGGCPSGASCIPAGRTAVCVLGDVATPPGAVLDGQGGCTVASGGGAQTLVGLFALLGFLVLGRFRGKRSLCPR